MNYAIIEDGVVINVIWILETNKDDFPNAVYLGDRPVQIGDTYKDGRFFRDGAEVLTALEQENAALKNTLALLGYDLEEAGSCQQ